MRKQILQKIIDEKPEAVLVKNKAGIGAWKAG